MPKESTRDIVIEVRERIKALEENLSNHLKTHDRKGTALIFIIVSLAISLLGIVVKLLMGG